MSLTRDMLLPLFGLLEGKVLLKSLRVRDLVSDLDLDKFLIFCKMVSGLLTSVEFILVLASLTLEFCFNLVFEDKLFLSRH